LGRYDTELYSVVECNVYNREVHAIIIIIIIIIIIVSIVYVYNACTTHIYLYDNNLQYTLLVKYKKKLRNDATRNAKRPNAPRVPTGSASVFHRSQLYKFELGTESITIIRIIIIIIIIIITSSRVEPILFERVCVCV
jgi:hypothetical protein